jgi:DegV family protein with EDD domain
MVKGGRVSPWKGLIAKILNVNPIVSMDQDGKSLVFGKTYSQKANMEKVIDHIKEITNERKVWNYIVLHANNPDAANWYAKQMKLISQKDAIASVNISPVIGTSAGIGAASVAFMYE